MAAARPAHIMFPYAFYSVAAARLSTLMLFFSDARGRFALNGRFAHHVTSRFPESRDRSLTYMLPGPCDHSVTRMFPVISLIFHMTLYVLCMSHGDSPRLFLCHAYAFSLMLISLISPVMSLNAFYFYQSPGPVTPTGYPVD